MMTTRGASAYIDATTARQPIWENRLFLVVNDGDAVVFDSFLIVEHRISSKPCLGPALHYTPDRIFSILLLSRPAIAVTIITLKSSNLRKCNKWTLWKRHDCIFRKLHFKNNWLKSPNVCSMWNHNYYLLCTLYVTPANMRNCTNSPERKEWVLLPL